MPTPEEKTDNEQPTKRPRRQSPPRERRSFTAIMADVQPDGTYEHAEQVEFTAKRNINSMTTAGRNFLKNQAVALMRYGGMSPQETSYLLGIPLRTTQTWRSKATAEMLKDIKAAELELVQHRVAQSLNTSLAAVESVALAISEKDYVQKQDPAGVAKIFEMLTGYTSRLIEAKQRMDAAKQQADRRSGEQSSYGFANGKMIELDDGYTVDPFRPTKDAPTSAELDRPTRDVVPAIQ